MVIGTSYTRNWNEKSYNGNSSKTEGVRFADLIENQKNDAAEKIDVTKAVFTSNNPKELDKVLYTYYSQDRITCIREGKRNPDNPKEKLEQDELQWEIKLDNEEQYEKIMGFLASFPQEDNFRFATKEDFWNDFLEDKIDMEGFENFYQWTNHGEPNMGIGEDGELVGINRTKISDPNAKYFNDQTWIGHVWTEEEMWEQWNAQIEAASAMQRSNAPTGTLGLALRCRTGSINTNQYFKLANENGIIEYGGTKLICDRVTNSLKLGDCRNSNNCIQIALAEGGNLIVNKDNINDLVNILSMFSAEDQGRILESIQRNRMIENVAREDFLEQQAVSDIFDRDNTEKII